MASIGGSHRSDGRRGLPQPTEFPGMQSAINAGFAIALTTLRGDFRLSIITPLNTISLRAIPALPEELSYSETCRAMVRGAVNFFRWAQMTGLMRIMTQSVDIGELEHLVAREIARRAREHQAQRQNVSNNHRINNVSYFLRAIRQRREALDGTLSQPTLNITPSQTTHNATPSRTIYNTLSTERGPNAVHAQHGTLLLAMELSGMSIAHQIMYRQGLEDVVGIYSYDDYTTLSRPILNLSCLEATCALIRGATIFLLVADTNSAVSRRAPNIINDLQTLIARRFTHFVAHHCQARNHSMQLSGREDYVPLILHALRERREELIALFASDGSSDNAVVAPAPVASTQQRQPPSGSTSSRPIDPSSDDSRVTLPSTFSAGSAEIRRRIQEIETQPGGSAFLNVRIPQPSSSEHNDHNRYHRPSHGHEARCKTCGVLLALLRDELKWLLECGCWRCVRCMQRPTRHGPCC